MDNESFVRDAAIGALGNWAGPVDQRALRTIARFARGAWMFCGFLWPIPSFLLRRYEQLETQTETARRTFRAMLELEENQKKPASPSTR